MTNLRIRLMAVLHVLRGHPLAFRLPKAEVWMDEATLEKYGPLVNVESTLQFHLPPGWVAKDYDGTIYEQPDAGWELKLGKGQAGYYPRLPDDTQDQP